MAKEKTTAVALATSGTLGVIDFLKGELAKLQKETEVAPFTNGEFSTGISIINVHKEQKDENLILCVSVLLAKEQFHNAAYKLMGDESHPAFTINGFTKDQWLSDIRTRRAFLKHDAKKKEIEALIEEGKEFISQKDREDMYKAKLAKAFGIKE